jgi:2-polyprenyl-6-methoxyphenol hydroxylase-like FAD-dependent oxidoreductase
MTLEIAQRYDENRITSAGTKAVVLGGGMAGLLAARVLADGFENVVLVDRDPFPDRPTTRTGVPQANHVHAMLEAGRAILDDLFDGYTDEIRSSGGTVIDAATEFDYYHKGDFIADGPERLPMLCASRPLFEQVVRERVAGLDRVSLRPECRFTTYITDDTEATIEGVTVIDEGGNTTELPADLVVDATGRTSRTPRWLERHGYRPPPVDEVEIDLAYSTVTINRPPNDTRGFLVAPSPPLKRGGTLIPIENAQWLLTLFGLHDDHPPTTTHGFRDFAASLPTPELKRVLDAHALASENVHHYPFPSNRWRHYERLDRFPSGLIAIGDAVASFNPIYGQGMSVAALEALQLHHTLATGRRTDLGPIFFDRIADVVKVIWRMTVSSDFEFPETEGPKPYGTALFNRYTSRLIRTAHTDGDVADAFARVLRLERSPISLFHPNVLSRVLLPL